MKFKEIPTKFNIKEVASNIIQLDQYYDLKKEEANRALIEMGKWLIFAKSNLPHGKFMRWCKKEFDRTPKYCQSVMRISMRFESNNLHGLGFSHLEILATMKSTQKSTQQIINYIYQNKINKAKTVAAVRYWRHNHPETNMAIHDFRNVLNILKQDCFQKKWNRHRAYKRIVGYLRQCSVREALDILDEIKNEILSNTTIHIPEDRASNQKEIINYDGTN